MKKILSILMVLTLLFSSTMTVFADSYDYGVKIIKDNEKYRITEDVIDDVKTIATYDKINNTLSLEWFELNNKKNSEKLFLNLNDHVYATSAYSEENTFSNYEYKIVYGSPNNWELRRPQDNSALNLYYFTVNQTSALLPDLNNFKDAVDDINDLELRYLGASASVPLLTLFTIILAATGAGAGPSVSVALVAAGVTGAAFNYAIDLERRCDDAFHYYFNVFYAK